MRAAANDCTALQGRCTLVVNPVTDIIVVVLIVAVLVKDTDGKSLAFSAFAFTYLWCPQRLYSHKRFNMSTKKMIHSSICPASSQVSIIILLAVVSDALLFVWML